MNEAEYSRMDRAETSGWWFVAKREFVRAVLDGLAIPIPGRSLLDAGCGAGATLRAFSNSDGGAGSFGLDPSPEALHFAGKKCDAQLVCGSAESMPFEDRSFSMVLMLDVLEHLRDDRGAASGALRVLSPGGILVMTVPAYPFLWCDHDVALHHHRRYLRSSIRNVLHGAGFEILYLGHAYATVLPLVVLLRLLRRIRPRAAPEADIGEVHPLINQILLGILRLESRLLRRIPLPFGSSILAVARRP